MKSVELFITGKKVIDVGYRPFLLLNALKQGIQNINAFNTIEEGKEMVVVRLQGEDDRVTSYINFLRSNFPVQSVVEEIIEREFNGLVEDAFTRDSLLVKYEEIYKEIAEIKATLMELKAKAA